jgi:hypothetical protein
MLGRCGEGIGDGRGSVGGGGWSGGGDARAHQLCCVVFDPLAKELKKSNVVIGICFWNLERSYFKH